MKDRAIDYYLNNALIIDFVCAIAIWLFNSLFSWVEFDYGTRENNVSILSYVVSSSISLVGFILAALTIIVAIKSNLTAKKIEEVETPLELFFSTTNYRKIIEVFQGSIIEFTFCFITALITILSSDNLSVFILFKINLILIFIISISIVRSLLVLFRIINIRDRS